MKITEVTVDTRNCAEMANFYGTVLGLPVTSEPGKVSVRAGSTTMVFRENQETEGCHHFAFTIPANRFAEAKQWVRERVELLSKGGEDEFEYDAGWNARSLYFGGPEGSVIEFIIRRDLENFADGEFSADDLGCVSEVGVAVPDVLATVESLSSGAGIEPYGLVPRDRFSPVGDINGLIILVSPDRTWFPADDLLSKQSRIQVKATGATPGSFALGELSSLIVT